jgi:NTE family protein
MAVGFALSGGGNLGPMQAGAIVALAEHGIFPDILVGTSVGALNAAFLASRPGPDGARTLADAWTRLQRREIWAIDPLAITAGLAGMRNHLLSSGRLRALIDRWVQFDRIEDAPLPVAVTATDALSGELVLLTSGEVGDVLSASAAIPGLLPPVRMGDRWLVDGSLAAGWPVRQAQALGADDVYLINTATAPRPAPPRGAIAIAMNAVSLVTARSNQEQLAAARLHAEQSGGTVAVVPTGLPEAPGPYDLSKSAALVAGGYEAASAWLESRHRGEDPSSPTVRQALAPEGPH